MIRYRIREGQKKAGLEGPAPFHCASVTNAAQASMTIPKFNASTTASGQFHCMVEDPLMKQK